MKNKRSRWELFFRILAIIFVVFGIVILGIAAFSDPESNFVVLFVWLVVIIGVSVLLFFIFSLVRKFKHKKIEIREEETEKLPRPLTFKELQNRRRFFLEGKDYMLYPDRDAIPNERFRPLGDKNMWIYTYIFEDQFSGKKMSFIVNAHYPEIMDFKSNEPSDKEILISELQLAGTKEEAIVEIIKRRDPLSGREEEIKTKTPILHKKINKKEKKDEL